jgi:hypothetical protein
MSAQQTADSKQPKKKLKLLSAKLHVPAKVSTIIIILLAVFSIFMFLQYREAKAKLNPTVAVAKQTTDLVGKVGKLIILPNGETPTIATVKDAAKLASQPFFTNAKDGDKVLVYNKEKRAILYRPSTNQLVNVSTVTTGDTLKNQ